MFGLGKRKQALRSIAGRHDIEMGVLQERIRQLSYCWETDRKRIDFLNKKVANLHTLITSVAEGFAKGMEMVDEGPEDLGNPEPKETKNV